MVKKETNVTKEMEPADDNMAQFVVKEGKKIAKRDFAKFSAIVAVIFSGGLWVIKSIWYAYFSGKFSVYRIDSCYINADNENVFLQIIQLASILVVWLLINYIYYQISVAEDKSRFSWKKKIKILFFWIVEMLIAFTFVSFSGHTQFWNSIGEITLVKIVTLLVVFLGFCLMINIYAIEFLLYSSL